MKKIISIILIVFSCVMFYGCYQDLEENSLDEYIEYISKNKHGYSIVEIDDPEYFLPSMTFLQDCEYIKGSYHWHEDDPIKGFFSSDVKPEVSIISLQYDETTYYQAKQFMLQEIIPYDNKFYEYNNYVFYENSNFIKLQFEETRMFPRYFTMACYNDENYTLIFIGFNTLSKYLDNKYLEDIDSNFTLFIDEYYGKYYNFSK